METEKAQPGAQLICFFVGAGPGAPTGPWEPTEAATKLLDRDN